jgi:hypothetical protein
MLNVDDFDTNKLINIRKIQPCFSDASLLCLIFDSSNVAIFYSNGRLLSVRFCKPLKSEVKFDLAPNLQYCEQEFQKELRHGESRIIYLCMA